MSEYVVTVKDEWEWGLDYVAKATGTSKGNALQAVVDQACEAWDAKHEDVAKSQLERKWGEASPEVRAEVAALLKLTDATDIADPVGKIDSGIPG